ncbi:hypothetical protein KUH32_13220 [Thalassococcus sp. CAU 1522]|uniref:Uncharacterized protein n=1 Tax=Thalassococcus arenae TaxID=2851652 RepID=A0ABS6N9Q1_9RHOB|nr:hypothetical protein [Thalassococcus arenae]MBV2360742.1 hypothetical protein [Thalassococcus arenae]
MSNVIAFQSRSRIGSQPDRLAALVSSFATHRRRPDDVFWMKENAELLNILECTGIAPPVESLAPLAPFYESALRRLEFFPQYYRFLLSMVLDLEALGFSGQVGQRMVDWAMGQNLARAELSDLQRAEARRLMARRGVDPIGDRGLDDRLRAFASRSETFSLPNKKAAYELTHIVFYLSEYGRRDPDMPLEARQSLHFAGILAYLDQNADLLAEICTAMVYAGETPPQAWTALLSRATHLFEVTSGEGVSVTDDYHEFLVCNWHEAASGGAAFRKPMEDGRMRFDRDPRRAAALREMSQALFQMDGARTPDWPAMRRRIADSLSPVALDVLDAAEASSTHFEAFFAGFARAGQA